VVRIRVSGLELYNSCNSSRDNSCDIVVVFVTEVIVAKH
jgi:hypothetical protein